jgi:hypothetical protein
LTGRALAAPLNRPLLLREWLLVSGISGNGPSDRQEAFLSGDRLFGQLAEQAVLVT